MTLLLALMLCHGGLSLVQFSSVAEIPPEKRRTPDKQGKVPNKDTQQKVQVTPKSEE